MALLLWKVARGGQCPPMKKQGQTAYNMECPEFESRPSSQYGKINCMEKPDKNINKKKEKK